MITLPFPLNSVPVLRTGSPARVEPLHFVAVCTASGCSFIARQPEARACTRANCGLSDRHHAVGGNL